jgi:RNA polymerase sigma-70 factor (ECF subfamily)
MPYQESPGRNTHAPDRSSFSGGRGDARLICLRRVLSMADSQYNNTATEVTQILDRLQGGDPQAAQQLFPLVYEQLHHLAERSFRSQPNDHTLQPTALVHEAYLRMVQGTGGWKDRAHFLAVAARAMRQILVNHAQARLAVKRGGGRRKIPLRELTDSSKVQDDLLVVLHEALDRLAAFDETCSRLVELRFFGGLTVKETATVLGISPRSVDRQWSFAKGWLCREIAECTP